MLMCHWTEVSTFDQGARCSTMCDPEAGSEDEREGDNRRARPMLAGWRLRHGWGVREEATEHTGTGTLGDVPAAGLLKWWQQQQRRGGKEVGTVATAVRVEAGSSREGERTEAAGGPQRAGRWEGVPQAPRLCCGIQRNRTHA